ncbi:MAG: RDD family protein [Pseudomonadota bacterium]
MPIPDPVKDAQFYDGVPLRRIAAFVVDTAVVTVLSLGVLLVGLIIGLVTLGLGVVVAIPVLAAIGFLYRWTMLSGHSATLGMLLLGLEVRRSDGEQLDQTTAFVHAAGFTGCLYIPVLLIGGWLSVLLTAERRMLHDLPLGTVVINRPLG